MADWPARDMYVTTRLLRCVVCPVDMGHVGDWCKDYLRGLLAGVENRFIWGDYYSWAKIKVFWAVIR